MVSSEPAPPLHVVVGIIENSVGELLVAQRPPGKRYAHHWEFPGGKVEENEIARDALVRELEEELKIRVVACEPLMDFTDPFADDAVRLDVWRVSAFEGALAGSNSQSCSLIGAEGQALRWVKVDALKNLTFPPANLAMIKRLQLPSYYAITDYAITDSVTDCSAMAHWQKQVCATVNFWQSRDRGAIVQFRAHALQDMDYVQQMGEVLTCLAQINTSHCVINRAELILEWFKSSMPESENVQASQMSLSMGLHQVFGKTAVDCGIHLRQSTLENLYHFLNSGHGQSKVKYFRQAVKAHPGFVGASCHNEYSLNIAQLLELDYLLLSPVLPTKTHPKAEPLGWKRFAEVVKAVSVPVYALGGLRPEDCSVAQSHGAAGVAGISAFNCLNENSQLDCVKMELS